MNRKDDVPMTSPEFTKREPIRFVQISVYSNHGLYALYALDQFGRLWKRGEMLCSKWELDHMPEREDE